MSDYLCEGLIVEIFTRLPPKSLLRFRSLSKSLCSCICSPGFIRMHTFRSPQKIGFIHTNREKNIKEESITLHGEDELPLCLCPKRGYIGMTTAIQSLPCNKTARFTRTVGSCNGIYCLRTKKGLILWNPFIRRKLSVHECPRKYEPGNEGTGFGFDPVSDDYKIVSISSVSHISFVYAMKTGTWCEIASPKPRFFKVMCLEPFLFNGVLHWEVISHDTYPSSSYILTFNLSTHVFGIIPCPGPARDWLPTGITTIQDSLALICYRKKLEGTWIWVWRDASWSVGFKLETGQLPIDRVLQLQPSNKNGDLLLSMFSEGPQVYNTKTGVLSRVVNFSAASRVITFDRCVETLQLLDMKETASETTQL